MKKYNNNYGSIIKEIYFDVIDSTQIYARNNAWDLIQQNKQWYVIRADEQTKGIGSADRK